MSRIKFSLFFLFILQLFCPVYGELEGLVYVSFSGKTGSTTLEKSFKKLNIETYRRHRLEDGDIVKIRSRSENAPVLLICSIRDPISRMISSFFHHLERHMQLSREEILNKCQREGVGFLNERFIKKIGTVEMYQTFYNWKVFDYDCLQDGSFNFKRKYQLKKMGNLYFINVRFEDIAQWENIIRSIKTPLNLSNFKITPVNRAQNKWYKDIYKDFLAQVSFPQELFDEILSWNGNVMAHFYTDEEIQAFIKRWRPHIRG